MTKIQIIICVIIIALLFNKFIGVILNEWQQRIHVYWLERREKRRLKREERKAYKNCQVTLKNNFLRNLTKIKIIMFEGVAGSGKTLLMNLVAKWLRDVKAAYDHKNRRMQKYLFADYLAEKHKLVDKNLLDIYSNIIMHLDNLKTQDAYVVIEQLQKACQKAVVVLDEIGSVLPKAKWYELQRAENYDEAERIKRIADFARYIRHYIDGWLLLTEQDGSNLLVDIRRYGYALVTCGGVWSKITLWGKFKKFILKLCNILLPGWIIGKPLKTITECLFPAQKILTGLKLLLPNWFNGRYYYEQKLKIQNYINNKHTRIKLKLEYNGYKQFLIFTNKDILQYDTRARAGDYQDKFDEQGLAKGVNYEYSQTA